MQDRRTLFFGIVLAFLLGAGVFALSQRFLRAGLADTHYSGEIVPNFVLLDQRHYPHELYRMKVPKAVVLMSYGIGCPIARKAIPALKEIQEKFGAKVVRVLLLDSNPQDNWRAIEKESEEFSIPFPILLDDTQEVARILQIKRTCEAFVIETASWKLLFRGPVDNRFGYGTEAQVASKKYLENALSAYLKNEPIEKSEVPALGCAISFKDPPPVDYHGSIAPILRNKCASCHYSSAIAPSNLWTYEDVKGWSSMIRELIRTEQMPPQQNIYSRARLPSRNLTKEEKALIYSWIDKGFPEGTPPEQSLDLNEPFEKWRKSMVRNLPEGRKPIEFSMKEPIAIPANSPTPWHYEPLIENAAEDILVSGIKAQIENTAIMQHGALLVLKQPIEFPKHLFQPQLLRPENIYNIIRLMDYKGRLRTFGKNLHYRIPKGSYVYLELHFANTGREERQNAKITLLVPPKSYRGNEVYYMPITASPLSIPPNNDSFWLDTQVTNDRDAYVLALMPHMHLRGHTAWVYDVDKNGKQKLLQSFLYRFKSRIPAFFDEPILVKAGNRFLVKFEYDNSIGNPAPIDPNETVGWGENAFHNEMATMHVWLHY